MQEERKMEEMRVWETCKEREVVEENKHKDESMWVDFNTSFY